MAAIIHNSDINYTLYYGILDYFKSIMSNHPSIGIVTQGNIIDFDTREFQKYPVGNVSILRADFNGTTTDYEIQLIVADKIKNKNDESSPITNEQEIAFYGVDDTIDIWANTLGILNDLTAYTQKSVDGLEINGVISNEPFEDRFNNGLGGWVSTFVLTVHNDRNRCLFELLPQPTTTTTAAPTTSTTQAPTTTTTLSPTTSTTLSPTTSTTLSPTTSTTQAPTTSTTTSKPTWRLRIGGFNNQVDTNFNTNNPLGLFGYYVGNTIYTDNTCSTISGTRGRTDGLFQITPGNSAVADSYNTAGYNTSQYYTFMSASIKEVGGEFVNISGSGIYDLGSTFLDVYVGACTSVTQEPS